MSESVDVLVVGAGHAGLAMSSFLTHEGRDHVVLERRHRLGGGWQDRWDEFTLVTPNWTSSFPGWAYEGRDPDGFMGRDEIAARVARYAQVVRAPVLLDTEVQRLRPLAGGAFLVTTSGGELFARQAVVATGSYHTPRIPQPAERISPRITQLHSHEYRNQAALPDGAVLVVGSGQTGLQLAEELFEAGRRVFISVGSAGRVPRRYRGRDIFAWLADVLRDGPALRVTLPTADQLPDGRRRFNAMPALTGRAGGHDTNLRRYAADGMTLGGRLAAAHGELLTFAGDLPPSLQHADRFFDERFRGVIDAFIERAAIDAPPADDFPVHHQPAELTELNLLDGGLDHHLGHGLRPRLPLDRRADPRRARLPGERSRRHGRRGPVLPRPAVAALPGIGVTARPAVRRSVPRGCHGPAGASSRGLMLSSRRGSVRGRLDGCPRRAGHEAIRDCVEAGQSTTDSPLDSGVQLWVALHRYATLRGSSNDFPWPDTDDLLDALISRLAAIDAAAVASSRVRDPSSV